MAQAARLSIVVPVFNDAAALSVLLGTLQPWRASGIEVIVVDGGSQDSPQRMCDGRADQFLRSQQGRAAQQHTGALAASADTLWFLHADCLPPDNAPDLICHALQKRIWGRFDVRLTGKSRWLPAIAFFMNHRSRLTGICTGDQGIFVQREHYLVAGGFPQIALMEDIALSKLLKARGMPAIIQAPLQVSARRWDQQGPLRTILQMWWLRLRFWAGADPQALHRSYYGH
jgi:rSAM/selenodomain-associated transferase 2